MLHAALHTTTVQPSSHNQRHVLIGKQWYQLPELIPAKIYNQNLKKGKGSPYSVTERRVPELIPVLGSQPAGDMNHNP